MLLGFKEKSLYPEQAKVKMQSIYIPFPMRRPPDSMNMVPRLHSKKIATFLKKILVSHSRGI